MAAYCFHKPPSQKPRGLLATPAAFPTACSRLHPFDEQAFCSSWWGRSDAERREWALLEPLIEICRPRGKTPPQDLRRTMAAILRRHQNGAKWRAVPEELGPWWRAAQIFMRWARAGVWERLLNLVQERGVELGMVCLDGTNVRAHQKAAGAARRGISS